MVNPSLLFGLMDQVRVVEADLRSGVTGEGADAPLRAAYERLLRRGETSATWAQWLDEQLDTAAVMWVLATVLVRFAEDNQLLAGAPPLSGADEDSIRAAETAQSQWFAEHPSSTSTDLLLTMFRRLAPPGGVNVLGEAVGLFARFPLSQVGADDLLAFWKRTDSGGQPFYQFRDPNLSTCFTGDLYQDLSRSARDRHALILTPEMVVSLVLDHTLTPALEGDLAELRIIDPACGSGGFLLSAFQRVVRVWEERHPSMPRPECVLRGLQAVHGVDRYLPAVVITRFRLLVAALRLLDGAALPGTFGDLNIVPGDALLSPPRDLGNALLHAFPDDDERGRLDEVLEPGRYQVVVSEPPYITIRDRALDVQYRQRFRSCAGPYALTVPFAELMFELATPDDHGGHVGQFVSNSFMKREFGRKLVEDLYGKRATLTHILDTSGAFIPGRGTPTALIIGRNRPPTPNDEVLVVGGLRGEPTHPTHPQDGVVWQSIVQQSNEPNLSSEWSESFLVRQAGLTIHPWNLAPPRTTGVVERMARDETLGDRAVRVGYAGTTGSDSVFVAPRRDFERTKAEVGDALIPVITGSEVRDWVASAVKMAFFPRNDRNDLVDIARYPGHLRRMWPYRTILFARKNYSGGTYLEDRRAWFDWHQVASTPGAHQWAITFSWVSTHNQFALVRDHVMPLNSAPVIKLPEYAADEDHFGLLGLLNSSAACFWLKQHSQSKGHSVPGPGATAEPWMDNYEFTPSRLRELPLPKSLPTRLGAGIAELAQQLVSLTPSAVLASGPAIAERLTAANAQWHSVRAKMIALQEEIDWEVYNLYGLTQGEALVAPPDSIPGLSVGERAFEVVLARDVRAGKGTATWFERHGAVETADLPQEWESDYRDVVDQRIHAIRTTPGLGVLERPEYKRRWTKISWDDLQRSALASWILDRCEDPWLWFDGGDPRPLTVAELAERVGADPEVAAVAALYAPDRPVVDVIASCVEKEHVPYLAAWRLRESGLAKHAEWERAWWLQHEEDLTESVGSHGLPVPPRYSSSDLLKLDYWRLRGKYDVSGERFISYPWTSPTGTKNLLLGWAGWDTGQRAAVLMRMLTTSKALGRSSAVPLLAGLLELVPWYIWLPDGHSSADEFLAEHMRKWEVTVDELQAWRPPKSGRGRPPKNQGRWSG